MSESTLTIENTFKDAADRGLVVKIPTDYELFLDLDTLSDFHHFRQVIGKLPDVKEWARTPSKSGYPKSHVVVTMHRFITNEERILLQACLGSDRLHELLSYLAARQGNPHPSVFFEKR